MPIRPWLKLFRAKNLVTVPGDVLVGAAAAGLFVKDANWIYVGAACLMGVLMYMAGLADNDIVGAKTDRNRPIPDGEISVRSAQIAHAICLALVLGLHFLGHLPLACLTVVALITFVSMKYNRTKSPVLMGLCRGLNVLLGSAAMGWRILTAFGESWQSGIVPLIPAAVWTVYIAGVTKYSEREVFDPTNDHKVALLVFGLMGLQLIGLAVFFVLSKI